MRRIMLGLITCLLLMPVTGFARHIIVSYDVSGSMYKLGGQVLMTSADLRRLNDYLVTLLLSGVPTISNSQDALVWNKLPDEPLLKKGDRLSYFKFGTQVMSVIEKRRDVIEAEFRGCLPDPDRPSQSFAQRDTYLDGAKIEVYDLYEPKEETYWIVISDEDADISTSISKRSVQQRKLDEISFRYAETLLLNILVNSRVNIRIRSIHSPRITRTDTVTVTVKDTVVIPGGEPKVFISSHRRKRRPVKGKIYFQKDALSGKLKSSEFFVRTDTQLKEDLSLNKVEVSVAKGSGEVVYTYTVPLKGKPLPAPFSVELPADDPELRKGKNRLQFVVDYRLGDQEKRATCGESLAYGIRGGTSGLVFLLIMVLLGAGAFLAARYGKRFGGILRGSLKPLIFRLRVDDAVVSKDTEEFSLGTGRTLAFDRAADGYDYYFDVGAPGYHLRNTRGSIGLYDSASGKRMRKVSDGDSFEITDDEGGPITISLSLSSGEETESPFRNDVFSKSSDEGRSPLDEL